MQSIDQIRKTNELSKVLKQHGLASDMIDASQKANQITNKKPNPVFNNMNLNKSNDVNNMNNQNNSNNQSTDGLIQKISNLENSKHIMGQRVDNLHNELIRTQEALRTALQKIDGIESNMRNMRNQLASAKPSIEEPKPKITKVTNPQSKPMSNDKNKMSDEVSIENIFYCGTK